MTVFNTLSVYESSELFWPDALLPYHWMVNVQRKSKK